MGSMMKSGSRRMLLSALVTAERLKQVPWTPDMEKQARAHYDKNRTRIEDGRVMTLRMARAAIVLGLKAQGFLVVNAPI